MTKIWELESGGEHGKEFLRTVLGEVVYDPNLDSFMLKLAAILDPREILEYHINKLQEIRDEGIEH